MNTKNDDSLDVSNKQLICNDSLGIQHVYCVINRVDFGSNIKLPHKSIDNKSIDNTLSSGINADLLIESLTKDDSLTGIESFGVVIKPDIEYKKYSNVKKKDKDNEQKDSLIFEGDTIKGYYNDDINIMYIHEYIQKRYQDQKDSRIFLLNKQLEDKIKFVQSPQSVIQRQNTLKEIAKLKEEIGKYDTNKYLDDYMNQVKDLIEKYNSIGPQFKVISFNNKSCLDNSNQNVSDNFDEIKYRQIIIRRYLQICKNYINIDIAKKSTIDVICQFCGTLLDNIYDQDNNAKCPNINCNADLNILTTNKESTTDLSPINNINTKNYEDRTNFWKGLQRYQGKLLDNKIPDNLEQMLNEYFIKIDYPIGSLIKKLPYNEDGTKGNTDRKLMVNALRAINHPNLYEDLNYITNMYWDWRLHDISHLEEVLMEDYDLVQTIFEQNKGENRSSCLNLEYRKWRHLNRRGYPCKPSEFKIVKTQDIIKYHENMWKLCCTKLGWPQPEPLVL
jgi:hypothetical protein